MADMHNGLALIVVLIVLLLLSMAGCGTGDSTSGGNTTPTQLSLVPNQAEQTQIVSRVPQVARVEIEISGPDIPTQTNSVPVSNLSSGQEIPLTVNAPLGDNRTVRVRGFDSGNILLFSGSESVTLPASGPIPITVFLPFRVTVDRNGNGTVTSSPPGFPCGANCLDFDHDTPATFTASAAPGSVFTGWSGGGCGGTGSCVVDQTATITATFTAAPNTATLTVSVTGPGTVTSSPGGISCPTACSASFAQGTVVTLTATPTGAATFAGWGGACSGTSGTSCTVTMNTNLNVAATFNAAPSTAVLTVTRTGNGTVTSAPAGINCGSTCSAAFATGSSVTLTAVPAAGFVFGSWGGACSGVSGNTCTVTMTGNQTVTVTFSPAPPSTATLTVTKLGTGSGTVTSSPAGINCGPDCSETYPVGTSVTLTAAPATGSTFAGWSGGGCSGTAPCTVTVTSNVTVTATFNVIAPTTAVLTLNKAGSGTGTVTSSPGGISCNASCSSDTGTFTIGTPVTLTATPATGSTFAGWSVPGCGGTTCTVTMTSSQTVTATFNVATVLRTLTVSKTGSGSGTVTSSPAGISCGAVCTFNFADGTVVTLTATPATGDTFDGWNGGGGGNNTCNNAPTCTLTMDRARSISARFDS